MQAPAWLPANAPGIHLAARLAAMDDAGAAAFGQGMDELFIAASVSYVDYSELPNSGEPWFRDE